MSPEFFNRWSFHQKIGILALLLMEALFSYLLIRFDLLSVRGFVFTFYIAAYMVLIVMIRLYDLYGRSTSDLIRFEAILAAALGIIAAIALFIAEGTYSIPLALLESLLSIAIYLLWMIGMKRWIRREFGPHEYICVGNDDDSPEELMNLNKADGNIFSSGKYFKAADGLEILDYMKLFRIGIMVITGLSADTCRDMLRICQRCNAMAFFVEKPNLAEYQGDIREVYIGGRKLWMYLPQN